MEFWGVEVKPGQTLPCIPGEEKYIHLSQIAIGENAESKQRVPVYVHFDGKKIMLGTFNVGTCDQIGLDLVFEKDFQVSHGSKTASVFCSGYTTFIQDEEFGGISDEDSEEEEEMMRAAFPRIENGGKPTVTVVKEAKDAVAKPGKPSKEGIKGKPELPKPSIKDEKDEDSDEDDEDEDSDDDEEMEDASGSDEEDEDDDDEEDDEDDDEEEEEETPKASAGKKRPVPASVIKTPGTEKKAKLATPQGQKPGEAKKNAHVATPHPGAKQGGKKGKETPGGSKQQTPSKDTPKTPKSNATPASGKKLGQYNCTTCQRNFNSESALSSHNTAKHSAGK